MADRYMEEKTRGHGGCGFVLTLLLVVVLIGGLLLFTTNVLDGYKTRIYRFFYPQKYVEQVTSCAAEFHVDDALIYAVIRTESGFREEVESHAGAIGLMQLMPSTFEGLQTVRYGEVTMTADALFDPDINIEYGTYLLSTLLAHYDGNVATAAAAYNAGMTNVDSWLSDPSCSSDGITLTSVPYEETERYIERIEKAYEMYEALYSADTES